MYDTPAAIDRQAGIMYINPKLWFKLTRFQQKFIKLHELGHYYLNTDIEEEADAYAFDRLVGTEPRSMKQMIETLETILDPNRTGHNIRIQTLYKRALAWDKAHPIAKRLNKSSGSSDNSAESLRAAADLLSASYQVTNETVRIIETKETQSDNNRTIVYCMIAFAALFLLKD